jgi:hypothetical protein
MPIHSIPIRDYPVRSHDIGPIAIAAGLSRVKLTLSRNEWLNPAAKVDAIFEISLDGGNIWSPKASGEDVFPWGVFPITFSAQGGNFIGKQGQIVAFSGFDMPLPEPQNPNRQIRGFVDVKGDVVRTAVTLEIN